MARVLLDSNDTSPNIPTNLVDQEIKKELAELRQARLFPEYDVTRSSLMLGKRLLEGELSAGSSEVKGKALAWCVRILSYTKEYDQADDFLKQVKLLGDFSETKIAEAFIISRKGDKSAALRLIAEIDSDSSRSASLIIVAHHDGSEGALNWMNNTGYAVEDLDSDGKFFLLNYQLQLARWDVIKQTLDGVSESDYQQTPILHHLAALATLVPAVPEELRTHILAQVPLDARDFPLASDTKGFEARRIAHRHFLDAVGIATQLNCPQAERITDEYALWLELRDTDPEQRKHGKFRLEKKLDNVTDGLGFVYLAFQFGIKLNLSKVERDIEQCIAINGGLTVDAAIARFALALAKPTPEEAANYIARYQDQLSSRGCS